jgi:hypothetical protein
MKDRMEATERKVKVVENEYFNKKIHLLHSPNFKFLIQIIGILTNVIF